jgi:hypothetical protein
MLRKIPKRREHPERIRPNLIINQADISFTPKRKRTTRLQKPLQIPILGSSSKNKNL